MLKIALMGASGFIGSRAVEMFHLTGTAEILPVVRRYGSLASLARFKLNHRLADAEDKSALRTAFSGCDIVINAIVNNPNVIVNSAEAAYLAAHEAGVKRMIYLSSASVHGQAPEPGTNESTPLNSIQPFAYNSAKVKAERKLLRLRDRLATELVILRPSIVFGPRSFWVRQLADELLKGTAYLIDHGNGVMNTIYVDNLLEAMRICFESENVDKQTFLVGDSERVTWRDFYQSIAAGLGVDFASIHQIGIPSNKIGWRDLAGQLKSSQPVQMVLPLFPQQLKQAVKTAIAVRPSQSAWNDRRPGPNITREMNLLQQCLWKLPSTKAESMIGYKPKVSFADGCHRSLDWLKFASYPVVDNT